MRRIGLKLWSVNTGAYFDEAVRLYRKGVFDYLELYAVPGSAETASKWKTAGMPFVIHAPHSANGFNLAERGMAASNLELYRQTRELADALSAESIIFHGGMGGSAEEAARQLKSFGEPRALVENKPMRPIPGRAAAEICRSFSPEEVGFIMKEAGCGFCLDFGHALCAANSQGIDPYAYAAEFARLSPSMFHLSDVEKIGGTVDTHVNLGRGELDIARMLELVPDGSRISIETEKPSPCDLNAFERDVEWLRSCE